ncbi:helix-turn-helix transcriptional regulator [Mycobacterium sp. CBMA271]|uniref:XRE family transcriptional regulator n=1 Tax=unclassified Mycobacteroides TaxID=2618759 RepID=UPI0012DCB452|nr:MULTISPECIES: XRE family transcriptional regulator [unclassified Mycobacteroides]MUM19472.1 secretion protein EspR [Mycobacteroides sp. CBMA 326]MUM20369.1 helix-turn-helix transcriptional regulator [Mycobacteroides sp. CBMA 271]
MTNDLDSDPYLGIVHDIGVANHRLLTQLDEQASQIQQRAAQGDDRSWVWADLKVWRRRVDAFQSQLRRDTTAIGRLIDANRRINGQGKSEDNSTSRPEPSSESNRDGLYPFKDHRSQEEFVGRLNRVFGVLHTPGRGPYSNSEFLVFMRTGGTVVSAPYLSQLRNAQRGRPSMQALESIAHAFRIDVRYFTDSGYADELDPDLTALELARNPVVANLTSKLLDLPAALREQLLTDAELRDRRDQTATS